MENSRGVTVNLTGNQGGSISKNRYPQQGRGVLKKVLLELKDDNYINLYGPTGADTGAKLKQRTIYLPDAEPAATVHPSLKKSHDVIGPSVLIVFTVL